MDKATRTEIEAATFRRLRDHLAERTDVQNIDLMNLAGFCRNCLGRWYHEAASDRGLDLNPAQAREQVYKMPYSEWKEQFQKPASDEVLTAFKTASADHSGAASG